LYDFKEFRLIERVSKGIEINNLIILSREEGFKMRKQPAQKY
jgi:hypothetical protein